MNRTTALLVALAILLGHALALHKTVSGEIAPPYDSAYVSYRIARSFVQTGNFAWQAGTFGLESYPSLAWIGVAALAERLYLPVNVFCQAVGFLSAFASVLVLGQFSPTRLSGVIAPLLFVVSGGIASAALSGTETAFFAFAIAFAFLAYERGWRVPLGIALVVVVATRPQGALFASALVLIEILRRAIRRKSDARPQLWLALAAPILAALAIAWLRVQTTGNYDSAWLEQLTNLGKRVRREGLEYLLDFLVASGTAPLFAFPLWYLVRGALSGIAIRACALTVVWALIVMQGGGGSLPFFEAMTPILAIMLVAVQEAMQIALDSKRSGWPQLTWVLFFAGLLTSSLASKFPGDIGPIRFEALHRRWMEPRTLARFGYEEKNGRMGLSEEILTTERLREIGLFLRDHVDPGYTVLSPWPGAIGYLSRMHVVDPLGRTTPSPGMSRTRAWEGLPRADVARALDERPEYIVPLIRFGTSAPNVQEIATAWSKSLDVDPHKPQRSLGIRAQLAEYELISVPCANPWARAALFPSGHFYFLRRRDLGLAPRLHVTVEGRAFRVDVEHRSHEQLADLRVQLVDRSGAIFTLRPTGELDETEAASLRTHLLLYTTGERRITLAEASLPDGFEALELRAVLRNPGAIGDSPFANACEEVVVPLE